MTPPETRFVVVHLHLKYGWTYAELGNHFGLTRSAVAGIVFRGREKWAEL